MLSHETRTELFRLAFQYKEARLWERLFDSQLFGVTLADGQIGYCCVMGMRGDHVALGVYVGRSGISSWYSMQDQEKYEDNELSRALVLGQDCLQCVFDEEAFCTEEQRKEAETYAAELGITLRGSFRYPHFQCYRPMKYPSPLEDEAEADILMRGLRGAIRIAKSTIDLSPVSYPGDSIPILTEVRPNRFTLAEDPLPKWIPPYIPVPNPLDEFTIARLKRCRKAGAWDCTIFYMSTTKVSESPYCIPATTFIQPQGSDDHLPLLCVGDYDNEPDNVFLDFADSMLRSNIRPEAIRVHECDLRGQKFFGLLARQLGIPFTVADFMPQLNQALEDLRNFKMSDDEQRQYIGAICRVVNERSFEELCDMGYEVQAMAETLLYVDHPDITPGLLDKVHRLMDYWGVPY